MKRLLYTAQLFLLGLFIFIFLATCLQKLGNLNPFSRLDINDPIYNGTEEFDPSLSRLNSIEKLVKYCDSLYLGASFINNRNEVERDYTNIVSSVVRKRFYHGYSYYGFSSNFMALLLSRVSVPGLGAVVIPDDILKYPYAACSQQSIVMMEVLRSKGFQTRKVSFQGKISGHFCFEVYYDGGWHFYDTNMEPDVTVLNSYGRPDIASLVSNPDILVKAYSQYPENEILDIFPTYTHGAINKFPAPRAMFFQKLSKFLSYFAWFFVLSLFIIVRLKYLRVRSQSDVRNRRVYFPQPETGTSSSYYPGFAAPGA